MQILETYTLSILISERFEKCAQQETKRFTKLASWTRRQNKQQDIPIKHANNTTGQ
jgi:hypothetical protein